MLSAWSCQNAKLNAGEGKKKKKEQIFRDDPQLKKSYRTQLPLGRMTDLQSLAAKSLAHFDKWRW